MRSGGLILLVALAGSATAQQRSETNQQTENAAVSTSSTLLDRVMPLKDPLRDRPGDYADTPVSIAVRVSPSFSSEWSFVLRFFEGGANVTFKQARMPIRSVPDAERQNLDEAAIEKLVNRTTVSIPLEVSKTLVDEFWKALEQTIGQIKEEVGSFRIDGSRYEIVVSTTVGILSLNVFDEESSEIEVTGGSQIARLINRVRLGLGRASLESDR